MDPQFYQSPRPFREIRAVYDDETVRVYQAFSKEIAIPALDAQTLVPIFKTDQIIWITCSINLIIKRTTYRSFNSISKKNESHNFKVLQVDLRRDFMDFILKKGMLASRRESQSVFFECWQKYLITSSIKIHWILDGSIDVNGTPMESILIALSGPTIQQYAENVIRISDITELIQNICKNENQEIRNMLLEKEEIYPIQTEIYYHLNMNQGM